MTEEETRESKTAYLLRAIGYVVTVIGVSISAVALTLSFFQIREDRETREATLYGLAAERLEASRKERKNKIVLGLAGQIPILERMARLGMELRYLNANHTNLRGATLPGANFWCSTFVSADLSHTELMDSDLRRATLLKTDLRHANLTGAKLDGAWIFATKLQGTNFQNASLRNTSFWDVDLSQAKGLTKEQLKQACGEKERVTMPEDWKGILKPCPKTRERAECPQFRQADDG